MLFEKDVNVLLSKESKNSNSFVVVKDDMMEDIRDRIYDDVKLLKNRLRPAKMNRGDDAFEDEIIRGDSLCWVTPQLTEELKLFGLEEYVRRLQAEFSRDPLLSQLGINNEYNLQFAVFPGRGQGYNRHRDAFPIDDVADMKPARKLTCLLYLNKDWEPEDGGQLRVFTAPGVKIDGMGEPFSFWGVNSYDIDPVFGRMIIFRSEIVEHAVLPCFNTERLALTFWAHGTGPCETVFQQSSIVQFSDPNGINE